MSKLTLHHIVREPRDRSAGSAPALMLLHGVRSNEQDLISLAPALDGRFFCISARAPITLGPGAFGWYHVEFTPTGYIIDEEEAVQSRDLVLQFVDEVKNEYPVDASKVFLMGFSQGCIMSIGSALANPRAFAGVVGMSGRLLDSMAPEPARAEEYRGLPVMVVHGTHDSVIPIEYGRAIRDQLRPLPIDLTYREYPMAHYVSTESLSDINTWLARRLDTGQDWRTAGA